MSNTSSTGRRLVERAPARKKGRQVHIDAVGAASVGLVLLIAVGGCTLAGWIAARRAASLKPADAFRRN